MKTVLNITVVLLIFMAIFVVVNDARSSTGVASWYGPGLYGNTLGCGGTLTTKTWGVANKSLPCGTKLTICYRKRCVAVSVIDRGPYVYGRDFDLTAAVASYMGFQGVQRVTWSRR